MTPQVGINAATMLLIVVIFTVVQTAMRRVFVRTLEHQRRSFLLALEDMQIRTNGPDTGAVPSVNKPGPLLPSNGPRTVRRPTRLS